MATPIPIKGHNLTLGAPKGLEDEVIPLPVFTATPHVTSAWELTPGELEEIALTGKIYLAVRGSTMPPVYIATESDMRNFLMFQSILPDQNGN